MLKEEQGLNSVFSQFSEQGVQILSMRNKANRLEELFVNLVKRESNATEKEIAR
ncbi:Uncharacterised protein [Providencia rettgeri]|uniref:Daunorubicin/doxorubicin resistance ATP-binding protein DrrA n=1 Tax=Providencia rettgeri TaxID=587 RepID=A0A379FPE7_PRORE|nr:Uncharacterised protein [Providencia rettgeri]